MRKKFLSALTAFLVVMSMAGCGDNSSSSSKSSDTSSGDGTSSSAEKEPAAESGTESAGNPEPGTASEGDESTGEPDTPEKTSNTFSMSVNGSDGKMRITRPADNTTPMGEKDTWTIFIYLCGTDLESGQGSATSDIEQMLAAEGSDNVKFVFQTGGTSKWENDFIGTDEAERWVVQNGEKTKVGSTELKNMGESDTFAEFLSWGVSEYPAEKMGVIFWDHGGGCISGACVDELNEGDTLTLPEINTALSSVYQDMTDKFEFIGFDCCLMGTAEIANVLASYARYFYGSQETEPGTGWDYTTYGTYLAQNPSANGADLGKVIVDSFYDECAQGGQEDGATLTVVDLSKFDEFAVAFNDFCKGLYESASNSLSNVVRGVSKADNFGGNNKSEGYTNMVDVGGIISQCSQYADGTAALEALKNCITYNKNGSNHANASGLSVYYPLKVDDAKELKTFSKITMSPYYLSLVDMIAKGNVEGGYDNSALFDSEGNWDNQTETEGEDYYNYADEKQDEQSKLITFEQEPALGEDGKFSFKLDEQGLANTNSISAFIYMTTDGNEMVELGETLDVQSDYDTGECTSDFDGYWFALPDGQQLATYIVSEEDERHVYTTPVYLNGQRTNLRFVKEALGVEVEGAWDGIGENGMAAREVRKLQPGDKIVPMYFNFDMNSDDENDEGKEVKGKEYEWTEDSDVTYAYLPAADYFYGFSIDDVYGGLYTSNIVMFSIDDKGKISFRDLENGEEGGEEGGEETEEGGEEAEEGTEEGGEDEAGEGAEEETEEEE